MPAKAFLGLLAKIMLWLFFILCRPVVIDAAGRFKYTQPCN
jgi:hypothetical protein